MEAAKYILERIAPSRRGRLVEIEGFPEIRTPADVPAALASLATAIGDGIITIEEATAAGSLAANVPGNLRDRASARQKSTTRQRRQLLIRKSARVATTPQALASATVNTVHYGPVLTAQRRRCFRPTDNLLWKAVLAIARKNTIDPALTKLKELQLKWDGAPRLDTWLHVACGTPNDDITRAAGLNLIGGMVRRVRNPACKHDEFTLFISKQGLEKSGLIEALAPDPEWYSAGVVLGEKQTELVLLLAGRAWSRSRRWTA